LGLKQAGFRVIGAVEIHPLAVETYQANHKNVFVWEKDITKISVRKVRKNLGLKPGQLDLLAGCPPCQGFSSMTKVSPTITGGCFNPSKGRFIHPTEDRAISMREAALLQSFPANYFFPFEHGKTSIAQMIGNALPPEFIRRHAQEITLFSRQGDGCQDAFK